MKKEMKIAAKGLAWDLFCVGVISVGSADMTVLSIEYVMTTLFGTSYRDSKVLGRSTLAIELLATYGLTYLTGTTCGVFDSIDLDIDTLYYAMFRQEKRNA